MFIILSYKLLSIKSVTDLTDKYNYFVLFFFTSFKIKYWNATLQL